MKHLSSEGRINQEVEIRALLDKGQKVQLENSLIQEGTEVERDMHIIDMYFCPQVVQSFEEVEMHCVGSFGLRIRKQTVGNDTIVELNTKMITTEGDHNTWEEHETIVSSFEEIVVILQTIGFKPFFTLEKVRTTYHLEDMAVCIEDIVGLGPVVEVEIMSTKSKSVEAKQQIRKFLANFGVNDDQIVAKSVTNMLMRDKSRF